VTTFRENFMPITRLNGHEQEFGKRAAGGVCVFTFACDGLRDPGPSDGAKEDLRLEGSLGDSCPGTAKEDLRLASFGSSLGLANESLRPGSATGLASVGFASTLASAGLASTFLASTFGSGLVSAFLASTGLASAGLASTLASAGLVSACGVFVSGCVFVSCVFGSGFKLSCCCFELYTNIYT
jgi:hypothetical protein